MLQGDRNDLESALHQNSEALRINFEGYTSEVRYTDRVLRFPALFADNGILGKALETIHAPNPSLLYSTVTGDPGDAGYFPLNAIRWMTPSRDIAALVIESKRNQFAAELYHFGKEERPMSIELYLLDPGTYKLTITTGKNGESKPFEEFDFTVKDRKARVSFTLPPMRLSTLHIHSR